MKLKLATADFTFPLLPHDRVLDLIAMLGFDGVDIGLFDGRSHLWPSREFANVTKAARLLKRKLANRGLEPADVFLQTATDFTPYASNHPEASRRRRARDWFRKALDYAAECGSGHITTLPGIYFDSEPRAVSWSRCCEELAWRVEHARQQGIVFGIEPHIGSIVPTPREARRLMRNVPGLTLTLDYSHFIRAGKIDGAVEPLLKYATHFHVRGARKGRLQCSFRENMIDYSGVLRAMKATGYAGYLEIEYTWIEWEHCNEVDNVSETVLFRDFLRKQMQLVK